MYVKTVLLLTGIRRRTIINRYEKECMEPELHPEFVKKMEERAKESTVKVKDFMEHFGLK
jgi:hypothetical protein